MQLLLVAGTDARMRNGHLAWDGDVILRTCCTRGPVNRAVAAMLEYIEADVEVDSTRPTECT